MTTFYIVRHGETEWNVKKLIQGHKDSPLTQNGINQAKNLARNLNTIRFDAAFSSDLLRAKRTAEILALEHKLIVTTSKALRERSFGSMDGIPLSVFQTELKHLITKLNSLGDNKKKTFRFNPDMENDEELMSRFLLFLRETAVAYDKKNVLIVTHGGVIHTLLIHLGFYSYSDRIKIQNTGYIKLECDGIDFFIKKLYGISTFE